MMTDWIPIKNGKADPMPKERQMYLVTYETPKSHRKYVRCAECSYSGITPYHIEWSKKLGAANDSCVIAYAPLPEPYEERG